MIFSWVLGAQKTWSYLLQIENMVVEIILQLFVCIVDAELLKAVGLKVFKAKNVQNTDGQTLKKTTVRTEMSTIEGNSLIEITKIMKNNVLTDLCCCVGV